MTIRVPRSGKDNRQTTPERDLFVERLLPSVRHRDDRLDLIEHVMRAWRSEPCHTEAKRLLAVLQVEAQACMKSATLKVRRS
jgi:hypothetical protein